MDLSHLPVVIFEFAGRRDNLELQLPLFRRVLDDHPNVQIHLWNLARTWDDNKFLRAMVSQNRISVFHDLYGQKFNDVWRHYAQPGYRDTLFVKIDDDVVFFETKRFDDFLKVVDANRDCITSAKVINNGASTGIDIGLYREFTTLHIALENVYRSREFADMAHTYAFQHWGELIGQPIVAFPTEDWVSINLVAVDYSMLCLIAEQLDEPSPSIIAGRKIRFPDRLGDEGAVNMLPRQICQGFLAAHLGFGPQTLSQDQLALWRKRYSELTEQYLAKEA
jgi:hypothetical protein